MHDEPFAQLRNLGFNEVVLSSNIEAAWDEPSQTLVIGDISTRGKDIGGFSLSGLLGGVSGDFFSGDEAKMRAALFGLTAREAKLKIEDKGLAAKAIRAYAEQNDMTEDQARGMLTMTASVALQQFAAQEPRLQDVLDAASQFIAKPGMFTLTVKSKSANGIGALEFAVACKIRSCFSTGRLRGDGGIGGLLAACRAKTSCSAGQVIAPPHRREGLKPAAPSPTLSLPQAQVFDMALGRPGPARST